MILGGFVAQLIELIKRLNPEAIFEFEEVRMINVKIDTVDRGKMFVYLEEPTESLENVDAYRRASGSVTLRLYFCKFEDMHNDNFRGDSLWNEKSTVHRQTIRDEIETTMVRPLIAQLGNSILWKKFPTSLQNVRVVYPRPRFDANEVSVGVYLTLNEKWCLSAYLPTVPEPPILEDVQLSLNWIDYLGNAIKNPTYETYTPGTEFTLPEIEPELVAQMAARGQIFDDWNTTWRGDGISYQPGDVITINQNTILWARFKSII